jgi:hypothetical protein
LVPRVSYAGHVRRGGDGSRPDAEFMSESLKIRSRHKQRGVVSK